MTSPSAPVAVASGYNAIFAYGTSSANVTTTNVKSIKLPKPKVDILDTTPITVSGRWRTKTIGLIDGDKAEVTFYYEEYEFSLIYATLATTLVCKVTSADLGHCDFTGIVEDVEMPDFAGDTVPTYKVTYAVTGAITYTLSP